MNTERILRKQFTDPATGELRPFNDPNVVENPNVGPKNQPELIVFKGKQYGLGQPWTQEENGLSSGPFYVRGDTDHREWQFMPDLAYLKGITDEPSFMHIMQMIPNPFTQRPEV